MRIELRLNKREAQEVLQSRIRRYGDGVKPSQALESATFKMKDAILKAQASAVEGEGDG